MSDNEKPILKKKLPVFPGCSFVLPIKLNSTQNPRIYVEKPIATTIKKKKHRNLRFYVCFLGMKLNKSFPPFGIFVISTSRTRHSRQLGQPAGDCRRARKFVTGGLENTEAGGVALEGFGWLVALVAGDV